MHPTFLSLRYIGQDKLYPQSVGWLWKSLLLTTITPQLLWLISNLFGGSHQINPLNQIIPFASARIAFVYLGEPTPVSGCSGKPPSQTLFRLSPCRRKLAGCHSTPVSGCLGDFSLICCNHSRLVTDFMPSEQMIPMTQTMRRHTCLATERKDPSNEASSAGDTEFFDANDDACCFLSERIHHLESNGKSSIPSISLS